ncbi:MAG TPA: diaminopropionate ammonia-lyase [Solirubrobacteraceae bacterium]|nr:diaminopropionate ammonia-lyase [Solirubrobacteraceae bacterium]
MSEPSLRDFLDNGDRTPPPPRNPDPRVREFHRSMPGYAATAVADAPGTAAALGLDRLVVKLETERFGLPAFKVLGASWAACRALSARAGRKEPAATFPELRALAGDLGALTLVAATDGNHGRAVAHVAAMLDLRAHILVPDGTARARIDAIAGEGAEVQIVDGSYDEAVELSAQLAGDTRLVISDTSWEGYEEVPGWVAEGYATIFGELSEQLDAIPPLVAIQIGVGALASAAVRALAAPGRILVGIEPADAACTLEAVRAGRPVLVPGPHRSVMAGLNCGLASPIALPDMTGGIDAFCAIDDRATERAVRLLLGDGLACGETGAAGVAGLLALRERRSHATWQRLGVTPDTPPAALAICTEGPTDPASFERITAG